MRGKAQRVARPAQTRLNPCTTATNFTKFLSDVLTVVIGGVKERIRHAILPSAVE